MRFLPAVLALWLPAAAVSAADRWQFEPRIALTGEPAAGVFHHFDGAGHKHVAVSGDAVAAVWEDNRDGNPHIYAAIKANSAAGFSPAPRVSDGGEAYDPAITGLGDGRFALAWEQDGVGYGIFASLGDGACEIFGPDEKVHGADGDQQPHRNPAVDLDDAGGLHLLWIERAAPSAPTRLWYSRGLPR